ncbi:MAG: CpaD family pilus assembly lipoprotein [Caulobacteraceae bacterium]
MTLTRTLLVAAAFSLAALCLAACANDPKSPGVSRAAQATTPLDLYPLKADAETDKIALALHEGGLSPAQSEALRGLVARRTKVGGGVVTISLPHGGAAAAAAARTADLVQGLLNVQGAPARRSTYESDDARAPLLVSYDYDKPVIAACGKDWGDLAKTGDNRVYGNFGCAVTANMAAQIAIPADLVHPRAEDAPDAERRMTILDKYRTGKVTTAEQPQAAAGAIAHVGQ